MAAVSWFASGRESAVVQQDEGMEWDVEIVTFRNGKLTTSSLPGMRWTCGLWIPDDTVANLITRRRIEALFASLRGGAVRLNLWNLLTPKPQGTLQTGTPQVRVTMAAGARTVELKNCNGTLLRGDRIQFGSTGQRVMVTADSGAPVSTNLTVNFEPAARLGAAVDLAVVYDKPYTQYTLRDPRNVFPSRLDKLPGFGVDLVEGAE